MMLCFLLSGAALLILYLLEKLRRYSLRAVFLKTGVSAVFTAFAACGALAFGGADAFAVLLLLGLFCGLLGDVWLDLKYVFPAEDAAFTCAGFASFGLGHVLYLAAMAARFYPHGREAYFLLPLALGAACGALSVLMEKPMKLRYGAMKPAVAAYGTLLFAMALTAGSLALLHGWREPALNRIFAGGVLFAVSDLILSGTYFGEGRERPVDLIANYLTYYPAQFLIAASLWVNHS